MPKQISPRLVALTFGILVISFLAAFYVVAWQEPTQTPPGGNVSTPLNVGSAGQSKAGGLILNTGGAGVGLIVQSGNVGIGTTNPATKLDTTGTVRSTNITTPTGGVGLEMYYSPGSGKGAIFPYDRTNSAYKPLQVGGSTLELFTNGATAMTIDSSGNVGIGTASPSRKLDVNGYINGQSGLCIGNDCRSSWPPAQACPAGQAITAINQNGSVVCQSFALPTTPSPPPAPVSKCVPGTGQSCDTVCANLNCGGCSSECPACNVTPCRGCSNPSGGWWCLCNTCR